MKKEIIITIAPTAGDIQLENTPVASEEISKAVLRSAEAGAAVLHLHARDAVGNLTADMHTFNTAVEQIKQSSDIILEASTGGLSDLTTPERLLPAENEYAELGSLNIGSLNFGDKIYCNAMPDVHYWISGMNKLGVKPSLDIFDVGNLSTALHLINEGLIAPPYNFNFVFDVNWGMPWDTGLMRWMASKLPVNSNWGAVFVQNQNFDKHIEAAELGADVLRVGFEDSRSLDNGLKAEENWELVDGLKNRLADAGFGILGTMKARRKLKEIE